MIDKKDIPDEHEKTLGTQFPDRSLDYSYILGLFEQYVTFFLTPLKGPR